MFASGIKAIYKKILGMESPAKKKDAYNYLESQITTNPFLKHQFESMENIKANKNSLVSQKQIAAFIKNVKERNSQFIKENKVSHLGFWKANKELFEYFNINIKDIPVTPMDTAIDVYATSKSLNEAAIKHLVFKKSEKKAEILSEKQDFRKKIEIIKESFVNLIAQEDKRKLKTNFKIINFLSECMPTNKKKMVQESALTLYEEQKKKSNFKKCAEKLFKLRLITEKIIKEATTAVDVEDEIDTFYKDKDAAVRANYGGGKLVKLQDLKYIKRIEISTPSGYKRPEKIIIDFKIPFYPQGLTRSAAITSAIKIKRKLVGLERIFLNTCIYQKGRTNLFDPVGTIWDVDMLEQAKKGKVSFAKLSIYLTANSKNADVNTWDTLVKGAYDTLKDFNKVLPELLGELDSTLTPENQNKSGQINRALISKYLHKDKSQDTAAINDDFGGMF